MTLADICAAVGGEVHDGDPGVLVTAAARFDTRLVQPGGLFVAFAGQRVDGHDFASAAVARGAAGVLAARPVGVPAVVVDDVRRAFGRLAAVVADRLTGMTVIGVTGSSGKTTTKDLLGQVLTGLGPTVAPPGNRNNELGVPETVLQADDGTRFLVLEMGARHIGDIAYLTELVTPHVGVVLNVGTAHVGEFGGVDAIAQAKGELVQALSADGAAVLNADDPRVAAMVRRTRARPVMFGRHRSAAVRATDVVLDAVGRASFTLCGPRGVAAVRLRLHGAHFVSDALAAAAVALQFTDDVGIVADALSGAEPRSDGRMRVTERPDGVTVVDDAYNANPDSVAAALRTLTRMADGGRRPVAVLGQMNELGDGSAVAHREVGELIAALGVRWLVTVGDHNAAQLAAAAADGGVPTVHVPDRDAAAAVLEGQLAAGDVVLVKGSNGVGLQHLAALLAAA